MLYWQRYFSAALGMGVVGGDGKQETGEMRRTNSCA